MAEMIAPREAYGQALLRIGRRDERVVVLDADVSKATMTSFFAKEFPGRFFNIGISEQDLVGTAAGLALAGKIPFANAYANFLTGRAWDQIRISVCYADLNVKVVGHNAGTSPGQEGATHLPLEDITLMRALPRMTVIVPADANEVPKAVQAALNHVGPTYIRIGREKVPVVTRPEDPFILGKANVYRQGRDASIIAAGVMLSEALKAAEELEKRGLDVDVINVHTVKPIDREAVVQAAARTGAIVTAEEHTVVGGLGGAVAEVLAMYRPTPLRMVGVQDRFGLSGKMYELMEILGLTAARIVGAVEEVVSLKKGATGT